MRGDRNVEGVDCLCGGWVVNTTAKAHLTEDFFFFPLEIP